MRYFGTAATPRTPVLPDTTLQLLLTAASGQAFDYPAGTDLIRVTNGSTLGVGAVTFNPSSTAAAVPTTGSTISSSVGGQNILISYGQSVEFQVPRATTGFSLIAGSSHSVGVEFWSRAGITT